MAEEQLELPLMGIRLDEYQHEAHKTSVYPDEYACQYLALGLVAEAGEVAGKIAKWYRNLDEASVEDFPFEGVADELGDVLWFVSELSNLLDLRLSDVAENNLQKLQGRQERGTLKGSGDDR